MFQTLKKNWRSNDTTQTIMRDFIFKSFRLDLANDERGIAKQASISIYLLGEMMIDVSLDSLLP